MKIITGFDLETTGLSQERGHRIVEIAAILYDFDTHKELLRYVQRINPQRTIEKKAFEVHGISAVDLADKPTWDKIAPKIGAILAKSDYIVAHNGDGFDFPFIVYEMIRVGETPPEGIQTFDTMLEGRWATGTGKNPNLGELCFACDVPYDTSEAHAADYDVECMMGCLWFGLDNGFYNLNKEET